MEVNSKEEDAGADLGWRVSCWSLSPPQDQRSPGLRETSLRWLQSRASEVNAHSQRERETHAAESVRETGDDRFHMQQISFTSHSLHMLSAPLH